MAVPEHYRMKCPGLELPLGLFVIIKAVSSVC